VFILFEFQPDFIIFNLIYLVLLELPEEVGYITSIESTIFDHQHFTLSCGYTSNMKVVVHVPDKAKGLTPLGELFYHLIFYEYCFLQHEYV
jgi:hypothetical protein